jgi:prepilin-type processing-associated H-X9-DG protein
MRSTYNPLNSNPGEPVGQTSDQAWGKENGAFGSEHPGGANFVYIDAHVEFITDDIDSSVYQALGTIKGND